MLRHNTILKKWPNIQTQAKQHAEKVGKPLKIFFQDEARFGRINRPQKCWAPLGIRPNVPAQIIREYTYVYGAIAPADGESCYLILPAMNGQCMTIFLQELSRRYANYFLLLVYDGAPCHSLGALNVPENMMIITLPPYSPNLNPVENNWDDMREKFFHNIVFDSMQAVEDQLVRACNYYEANPQIVYSISAWDWIKNTL
jgi:transposase